MPWAASVSMMNWPNGSRPTQPATPVRTPTRVRSMATFAAQPPMASGRRSEITNSPERGSRGNRRTKMIGHKDSSAEAIDGPRG